MNSAVNARPTPQRRAAARAGFAAYAPACLVAMCLAACGPKAEVPAQSLTIPDAAAISIVKVSLLRPDGGTRTGHQIDSRARIDELMAVLRGHEHDDWRTVEKVRPQELTVGFETKDALPLVLRIGSDWIAGVDTLQGADGGRADRWRPLAPGEHERLLLALRPEGATEPLRLDAP